MKPVYAPIITSEAGSSLTIKNWQEIHIDTLCIRLSDLLMKPGFKILQELKSLNQLFGWSGSLILDANLDYKTNSEVFFVQSKYDGHKTHIKFHEFVGLINILKPDFIILPNLSDTLKKLLIRSMKDSIKILEKNASSKELGLTFYNAQIQKSFLISDDEASLGQQGVLITQEKSFNLMDKAYKYKFKVADASCQCPTCTQKLTLAYLHHLITNTPLLCQRFIIQHNIWCVSQDKI
tara:strand:+ start:117 stop:824 length:708 start_codon:yes stop_codon:yes gene_type:complete